MGIPEPFFVSSQGKMHEKSAQSAQSDQSDQSAQSDKGEQLLFRERPIGTVIVEECHSALSDTCRCLPVVSAQDSVLPGAFDFPSSGGSGVQEAFHIFPVPLME